MCERWRRLCRSRAILFAIPILVMAALLGRAIHRYGRPIDEFTWAALAIVLAGSVLPGLFQMRWRWTAMILLAGVYIAFPGPFLVIPFLERWSLCDDHGGRWGLQISPGLRFGRDGPNTKLLESYLGPLPPNWWLQAPHFPYIRDGNERVMSRNPILRDYLPTLLSRLPDDAARKQVLTCLVDPENRLRVHQGLLLACLMELGYPPGLDAKGWWKAHRDLFKCGHEALAAAKLTRGWTRKIERLPQRPLNGEPRSAVSSLITAANYQERGAWGGHEDFGEAVWSLEWKRHPAEIDATGHVVWWPNAPEALFGTAQITDAYLIRYVPGVKPRLVPLDFTYDDPEFAFHDMFIEPSPGEWPPFGRFGFKRDGREAVVEILKVNDDELGLKVHGQFFRGLRKSKFLKIFRDSPEAERFPSLGL
jgi:hypothetical protein